MWFWILPWKYFGNIDLKLLTMQVFKVGWGSRLSIKKLLMQILRAFFNMKTLCFAGKLCNVTQIWFFGVRWFVFIWCPTFFCSLALFLQMASFLQHQGKNTCGYITGRKMTILFKNVVQTNLPKLFGSGLKWKHLYRISPYKVVF